MAAGDRSRAAVLATANPHKLDELRLALPGWQVSMLERSDYPPETSEGYEVNAARKARFGRPYAPAAAWVLGEDSGIEVAALGGAPGVESARWAPDGVAHLLAELGDAADRRARYRCVIVAVSPVSQEIVVEGTLDGSIVVGAPRGAEGFGYDPIFLPAGEDRTIAELGNDWKRRHSHRARAAAALAAALAAAG